jgi:hypothetical protein
MCLFKTRLLKNERPGTPLNTSARTGKKFKIRRSGNWYSETLNIIGSHIPYDAVLVRENPRMSKREPYLPASRDVVDANVLGAHAKI